jgi:rubrerythrin
MNVFDFAMKIEEEHQACYEKMAAEAGTKELKTIFTLLADSEREHHEHLTLLKAGTAPEAAQSTTLERAQNYLHDLGTELSPGDFLKNDADGYRHAIKLEELSIKLYEKLAVQEPNRAAANLIRQMAEEEKHHLEEMENIFDFVESPHTYLAWGEFSNLQEY